MSDRTMCTSYEKYPVSKVALMQYCKIGKGESSYCDGSPQRTEEISNLLRKILEEQTFDSNIKPEDIKKTYKVSFPDSSSISIKEDERFVYVCHRDEKKGLLAVFSRAINWPRTPRPITISS